MEASYLDFDSFNYFPQKLIIQACTLGFDIKVQPEGTPKIIEINGRDSGITGLQTLTKYSVQERRNDLRIKRQVEILRRNMQIMNQTAQAVSEVMATPCNYGIRELLRAAFDRLVHEITLERGNFANMEVALRTMPIPLEQAAQNKLKLKDYMDDEYRPEYRAWMGDKSFISEFITHLAQNPAKRVQFQQYPYIVAKGAYGAHGKNIRVFPLDTIEEIFEFLSKFPVGEALIEELIPSKEIQGYQDGCMRYLIDFIVVERGDQTSWHTTFEASYWRISPGSVTASTNPNQLYIANFTGENPALPLPTTLLDIETARTAVYSTINNLVKEKSLFLLPS